MRVHTGLIRFLLLVPVVSLIVGLLLSARNWGEEPDSQPQGEPLATFRVATSGDLLILPVSMGGGEYQFLLNSAATFHVFDESLRAELGRAIAHTAPESPLQAELFRAPAASVGNLPLRDEQHVTCLDLTLMRQASGEDIRGILGVPFFRDRIIRIDFDRGTVEVFDREYDRVDWGESLPLKRHALGYACTDVVRVGGRKTTVSLATGHAGSVRLGGHLFEHCGERGEIRKTSRKLVVSGAGKQELETGRLDELMFGPYVHHDVVVSKGHSALVGLRYLSRYVLTIDLSGQVMYLRRGKNFDKPDREDMSGLHVLKIDGQFVVGEVDEGSPADDAGMRKGDVIVEISGRPALDYRLADLRRLLRSTADLPVSLRVRRNQTVIPFSFRLRAPPFKPISKIERLEPRLKRVDRKSPFPLPASDEVLPRSPLKPLATFEIAASGDLLILPVTLEGQTYEFVLDSACTTHVFDTSLRAHLGHPGGLTAPESPIKAELFSAPAASVGKLPLRNQMPVICLDLTELRQATGKNIRGILGVPFFHDRIVRIDFDRGILDVFDRKNKGSTARGGGFGISPEGMNY